MTWRYVTCLALLTACLTAPRGAAAAPKRLGTRAAAAPAAHDVAPAVKKGRAPTTKKDAAAAAKKDAAPAAARPASPPRRLSDIHIEGEIPAPQVLFVTARDQRRFTQFHHRRYLKTSLQVGDETLLPAGIAVTGNPPIQPRPR